MGGILFKPFEFQAIWSTHDLTLRHLCLQSACRPRYLKKPDYHSGV